MIVPDFMSIEGTRREEILAMAQRWQQGETVCQPTFACEMRDDLDARQPSRIELC